MDRLVALSAVLAFVSVCYTAPQISMVVVDHGNVGVGVISGGTFRPESFSVGQHGSSHRGKPHVYVNEEGTNSGNTQLYPVKPLPILFNTGQEGITGQKGSEGGSIVISTVVLPNHENNNENKVNKHPDTLDASAVEATYASNGENNGFPSAGVTFSSDSGTSIAIGITGGNFGQGTLSFNKKRPRANVPQQQSAANNGDNIGYQNTGNEAIFSKGHGVSAFIPDASTLEEIFGSNSEDKKLSSVGNGFSTGGQGSVAIGAITGGHFGEGTVNLNNKRPGANVPQQQSAANNGDNIGLQNTGHEAPFSIGHGVSVYSPDASTLEEIFGGNSENKKLPSLGNGFSTGGQGSVAIGAITGGHFGEGTSILNNKRSGANVPQQQSAANNGDNIGLQNTGHEAPFSIGHGVSVYRPDASALEAIFGSNSEDKKLSSVGNGFSTGGQGNVAIGAITGGHFGEGTLNLNNKKPGANVPQQQSAANNGDNIGLQNTGHEAPFSIGHGVSVYSPDASTLEEIFGSNSEDKKLSSVGNGFSTSGQGSVAIGAITGGHFGEGTLNLNNKRPGANVPQQQSAANNGDNIGLQNTGHEAPFSIGHGVSVYSPDASTLEEIFGGNSENKKLPSLGNGFSTGGQGSVAIGAITGGHFGEGTSILNNKRSGANVPQQQSAANNGDNIGLQNTGHEAPFSIGHGVSVYRPDASALEAIFGGNSENKKLPSLGNGFSTGGQGSVAIGAITGGHFGEGTSSLNNKKPGANVPQQKSAANNGDIGNHKTGNETPRSIENGANSNGNGNAGVGYNDGQSSTGYNTYNNEKPWIWNR